MIIRVSKKIYRIFSGKDRNCDVFIKMEKNEFRVLIKHYFLMAKNTVQTKQ